MRILSQLAAAALLITATAACATEADEGRPTDKEEDLRSGGKGDGETCDFDQMSAATYYAQLAYQEDSDANRWAKYRIGGTWDVTATLENGNKVDLNVYFLAGGRVIAEYSEEHRIDSSRSEVLNQTVIVTRARINSTTREISIDGVGSGTPLTVRRGTGGCSPGIAFKFSSDIRSPGLTGDAAVIQSMMTSAYLIDPDHLDQVPNATARRYFEEDVASGKIQIQRK
jgi:hypothetical protein